MTSNAQYRQQLWNRQRPRAKRLHTAASAAVERVSKNKRWQRQLQDAGVAWDEVCPDGFRHLTWVEDIDHGTLIVLTASACAAGTLRARAGGLLTRLRERVPTLNGVRFVVEETAEGAESTEEVQ